MDLYVAQLPGLSVATHLARERAKADEDMPDNKSWRLGHSKQPKKPPRVSTPLKIDTEYSKSFEDLNDHHLLLSWRQQRQGSRPQTPVGAISATPVTDDTRQFLVLCPLLTASSRFGSKSKRLAQLGGAGR